MSARGRVTARDVSKCMAMSECMVCECKEMNE